MVKNAVFLYYSYSDKVFISMATSFSSDKVQFKTPPVEMRKQDSRAE